MTARIAMCVTYYNNARMLAHQLRTWANYPAPVRAAFEFVIVDDGSQEHPASDVLLAYSGYLDALCPALYRIVDDAPWNQHGARNLAARETCCPWLLMLDIDHVLTAENAERLVDAMTPLGRPESYGWFRFPRERIGAEDETRTKDSTLRGIPRDVSGVTVNPAMNCYLVTRDAYWQAGGYNEDFCGTYGGDSQFLNYLRDVAGEPVILNDVWLQVHTRHSVPDANERTLDRDPLPFRKRLADAKRNGTVRGHEPYCRFKWREVL